LDGVSKKNRQDEEQTSIDCASFASTLLVDGLVGVPRQIGKIVHTTYFMIPGLLGACPVRIVLTMIG
jgi:hypothetical protein